MEARLNTKTLTFYKFINLTSMVKFNCFNDFSDHLAHSIISGKDVYIFTYCGEDDCDYVYDDENKNSNDYYISQFIDIDILQRKLHNDFVDELGMDLVVTLDWITDEFDDEEFHYQRLFIFKRV